MTRPTLSWPISILAGAGIILLMLVVSALTSPLSDIAGRPAFADDGQCFSGYPDVYPACQTQTAQASITASATSGSSGGGGGGGVANTATPTFTSTATRTTTPTATRTTAAGATAASTPTSTRTPTSPITATAGTSDTTLPTPTPPIPADAPILTCVPGESVEIAGEAAPNTPLIVYFDRRAVGGGTSTGAGSYLLRIRIGAERPGLYLVEVRERGSRTLIQQLGCDVPALTPTATALLVS